MLRWVQVDVLAGTSTLVQACAYTSMCMCRHVVAYICAGMGRTYRGRLTSPLKSAIVCEQEGKQTQREGVIEGRQMHSICSFKLLHWPIEPSNKWANPASGIDTMLVASKE